MYNLEVLQDRLVGFINIQSGHDLYVGIRANLTEDHILVDGDVNMLHLALNVQKLFEEMSQPEVINSPEEANSLPSDTLILTEQGGYWESVSKHPDGGHWWREPGTPDVGWKGNSSAEDLTYPATVIHRSKP